MVGGIHNWYVGQEQTHIGLLDVSVAIKIVPIKYINTLTLSVTIYHLHVKDEFHFCVIVGAVDLEEPMEELLQVDIAVRFNVQHREEAFSDDTRKLGILYER